MPFVSQVPQTFERKVIENLRPEQTGVYGLFRRDQWIYVGRGDIRQRLLDHLNGDNGCIILSRPTHWVAEVTSNSVRREKDLITELSPLCNKRVG